ncbi:15539_t:CDS:2 [Funneliformis mosseae]|uniref:15539_t:CDS:1 n=1 Tax=Funneliformis mosseae TaxID=27381 RepID=A0A9N9B4J2_FUNMO|nr:15539_t:CDS:2 [Funneliformis mosseae]
MKSFTVVVFIALVLATLAILTPVEANWRDIQAKNTPGCETWDEESGVPWPDNENNDVQDISWTHNCIR